ncbi:hypothetical protein WICPIJ_006799 [Wickerhamomyces pijperi]|uniref:Uncharacterized protein n=1 Tax=Wickerhamomyces pijperi TaxID=599730 RepID=A0A9P8Q1E3_WICPI|nr:hypothetical protein WICPIJ_006799 [Wickerhamomyces pijperi]
MDLAPFKWANPELVGLSQVSVTAKVKQVANATSLGILLSINPSANSFIDCFIRLTPSFFIEESPLATWNKDIEAKDLNKTECFKPNGQINDLHGLDVGPFLMDMISHVYLSKALNTFSNSEAVKLNFCNVIGGIKGGSLLTWFKECV